MVNHKTSEIYHFRHGSQVTRNSLSLVHFWLLRHPSDWTEGVAFFNSDIIVPRHRLGRFYSNGLHSRYTQDLKHLFISTNKRLYVYLAVRRRSEDSFQRHAELERTLWKDDCLQLLWCRRSTTKSVAINRLNKKKTEKLFRAYCYGNNGLKMKFSDYFPITAGNKTTNPAHTSIRLCHMCKHLQTLWLQSKS